MDNKKDVAILFAKWTKANNYSWWETKKVWVDENDRDEDKLTDDQVWDLFLKEVHRYF